MEQIQEPDFKIPKWFQSANAELISETLYPEFDFNPQTEAASIFTSSNKDFEEEHLERITDKLEACINFLDERQELSIELPSWVVDSDLKNLSKLGDLAKISKTSKLIELVEQKNNLIYLLQKLNNLQNSKYLIISNKNLAGQVQDAL